MKRGFYTIMAAQFFSSLADNALLIAAIGLLLELQGPAWVTPLLKFFFTVSYVVLAAFVGAFADSLPKGKVMFITNGVKILGCLVMFLYAQIAALGLDEHLVVLLAYAIVGLGAAAYSPAKYGILTELLPARQLVAANGWIEGLTVASIILGTVLGGTLLTPRVSSALLGVDFPLLSFGIESPAEAAIPIIGLSYLVAAAFNLRIPDTGARYERQPRNPLVLVRDFSECFVMLWKDKLGQISLAVTTLFWGVGATLQFIVIAWAQDKLGYGLDRASMLQGVTALGIALGAVIAARFVPLRRSLAILPVGVATGLVVMLMVVVTWLPLAIALLVIVGGIAGFFVVPMNALLQHRGHVLLSAGHSIAVQNFNENVAILIMLALYSAMIRVDLGIDAVIVAFSLFVSGTMYAIIRWNRANQAKQDLSHLIGMEKPPH
ncbi:MAG: lysophospholipid transporter LplT [Burkholderiales bacterium]|nr:lysophospholipid transporter LplT [Burkholderiales bacterium]